MNKTALSFALAGISALPAISQAQTADTPPLSLQDAEKRLLDANPTILQARAAVAGARAGIDIAGARPNPVLTAAVTSINPARNGSGGLQAQTVN